MSFIRVFVGKTSNQVRHVIEQDVPFPGDGPQLLDSTEELEAIDLGFAEQVAWRDLEGRPTSPAHHFFCRLEKDHAGLPKVHDCPCSIDAIKARLRAAGPAGIPVKVRAWLATVLPADQVQAMGIARGVPIGSLKTCDAIRAKRDPEGGSRRAYFEALAQRQHQVRREKIERGIQRRENEEAARVVAAEQARDEMLRAIEAAQVPPTNSTGEV